MPYCLLSFGSNLGDRFQRIRAAARAISGHPQVANFTASRLFETPPIGGPSGQEPFLNGVACIETTLGARDVLALLHQVEQQLGRERQVRWDARSIDLDVVLYGDLLGENRNLAVPHPRYLARRFVLVPAAEVAGQWRDPRIGWTIAQLAAHLDRGVPSLALVGGSREMREQLCQQLRDKHGIQVFLDPQAGIPEEVASAWVSAFVPHLPGGPDGDAINAVPRLVAHLQWTTPESRWPATHQLWHNTFAWPDYRLEIDSPTWAVDELASAIDSMGCPLQPVTANGLWYVEE